MKRLFAFVSAVAICLCSISCAYAVEVNGSASAAQVQEQEWFCEEHQQPLIPDDEIPEGYEQICLQCNPVNQIQTMALSDQATIPVAGVAWARTSTGPWTNASTVIGEGQQIAYYVGYTENVYLRVISTRTISPGTDATWFRQFGFNFGPAYYDSSSDMLYPENFYVSNRAEDYLDMLSSTPTYSTLSGNTFFSRRYNLDLGTGGLSYFNTLYFYFDVGRTSKAFYIGGFTVSVDTSSVNDDVPTEAPDDSISQSWLGGLFDTIFGGIQEIVSGIENLPQSIASGLQSLFDGVTNAVNSIGTAITGAVDAASSAISSAVDSASSAITGIIGQQWNDQSGHNDEIDQAVSDLEDQDQQMGQVEDQYLDDFNEQQSDMAGTVSTFQWPSGITSSMTWITLQMNTIWTNLGGNVQMLFTFSMILGLSLIFLGRWRA